MPAASTAAATAGDPLDLCLALLDVASQQWVCTSDKGQRANLTTDNQPGNYTGSFDVSGVYAVVYHPRPRTPPSVAIPSTTSSFWSQYGTLAAISSSAVLVCLGGLLFMYLRLYRYRKKYKDMSYQVVVKQQELELEQLDAVAVQDTSQLKANPLHKKQAPPWCQ